jgi:glycosyltransferase involved in cell wall biosynthesis
MRVLVVAPFERGRGHGGSQRATAIAERLEERGFEVGWEIVRPRATTRTAKLRALARGEPSLVGLHERPSRLSPGTWDALLIAHSYIVPAVEPAADGVPAVVDFHNLEWRGLVDHARLERNGRRVPGARDLYLAGQVASMRRLERQIVTSAPLSLLVSEDELAWAAQFAPRGRIEFAPSVLPRAAEQAAAEVRSRRAPEPGLLVYVGTLTLPTNLMSLRRFLASDWPLMRAARPGLTLTIAGRCAEHQREQLERHPGVRAVGFVEDLVPLLASAEAVVMPFGGAAGTSLRPLFYALAGLPVIGPDTAFRGLPFTVGIRANRAEEWVRALTRDAARTGDDGAAREAAAFHQKAPFPWNRLAAAIEELSN